MNIKKFFKSYWKSLVVLAGILYLSFAPPSTFKSIPRFMHADKITHFIMFLAFTIVLIYDYCKNSRKTFRNAVFIFICLCFPVLLGGWIEIMQELFFKPRSADWFDWLADIAGVAAAWLLMYASGWINKIRTDN